MEPGRAVVRVCGGPPGQGGADVDRHGSAAAAIARSCSIASARCCRRRGRRTDGRSPFSALAGGLTDLYVCDVESGRLQQLTDDAFADLQPAWSHDGRTIAFVTERFSSDLRSLSFGRPQLARAGCRDAARFANVPRRPPAPRISTRNGRADDRDLYFVSDPDGTMNIYRAGTRTRSTLYRDHQRRHRRQRHHADQPGVLDGRRRVGAGIHGLRARPAAPGRARSASRRSAGAAVVGSRRRRTPMQPRPASRARSIRYLADLDSGAAGPVVNRDPRRITRDMSLEGIGQPYLSSGGGPFGTFVRAGGALLFGDMLGERRMGAAVQVGNRCAMRRSCSAS